MATNDKWLPSANPANVRQKPKKRGGMRAIDQGTRYDLTGNLRRLARRIERGEEGQITDICVTMKRVQAGGGRAVYVAHYGAGGTEDVHWMLSTARNRVEPA